MKNIYARGRTWDLLFKVSTFYEQSHTGNSGEINHSNDLLSVTCSLQDKAAQKKKPQSLEYFINQGYAIMKLILFQSHNDESMRLRECIYF